MIDYFRLVNGVPQSKVAAVRTLIHKHGYSATQCLFIGDSGQEAVAAMENRMLFVQVGETPTLALAGASRTVINLMGIEEVIDGLLREVKD